MQLLDSIVQPGDRGWQIELRQGDLTQLAPDEAVDLLVVSAFPNDYEPTQSSLVGALHQRGLSVEALASDKDIDIREQYSCWLSKPIQGAPEGCRFGRILCFEPLAAEPPDRVGDIFRGLSPMLIVRPEIRSLAMPIVAAGGQGYSVAQMLDPLLEAALAWLSNGLPLRRLIIAAYSDAPAEQAREVFAAAKARYLGPVKSADASAVDVFISYCHADAAIADALLADLHEIRPNLRVFIDREDVGIGVAWLSVIFENLERARKVAVLLSPNYLASRACKDEFNAAWIEGDRTDRQIIHPIYALGAALPAHVLMFNYDDCREADPLKLHMAAERLIAVLDAER